MVLMIIYTKTGDRGETRTFGGQVVPKSSLRAHAYGNLEELNSILGLSMLFCYDISIKRFLEQIQHELFSLGADLATPSSKENLRQSTQTNWAPYTENLEKTIDYWEDQLPPLKNFILPGGSQGSAFLHVARTVCRRAERSIVELSQHESINETIIPYINRLSDLLFVFARAENHVQNIADVIWENPLKKPK